MKNENDVIAITINAEQQFLGAENNQDITAFIEFESARRLHLINGCCSIEEEKELNAAEQYYVNAVKEYLPQESLIGKDYIKDEQEELKNFTNEVDRNVVSDMKRARFSMDDIKSAVLKCSPRLDAVREYYQEAKKEQTKQKTECKENNCSASLSR